MTAPARRRKDAAAGAGWVELTAAILRGTPALPGSLCRNRPELFDPQQHGELTDNAAYRHAQAVEICRQCPVLAECRAWVDRIDPSRRPGGVIAARINPPPTRK